MSLSRCHFVMGTARAVLGVARAKIAWPAQAVLPAGRSTGPSWAPSAAFLRQLPRLLELASVPGLSLGVVENGRTWIRGFGHAVADPILPAVPETVFEAASLGKPVFACAVLKLVDSGALELDRELYHYLPLPEAGPRMKRVTIRQVLSHTSGLPNWRTQPGPLEPAGEPGRKFSYSGEAFFYLQRVIEAVTGTPFARLMREQVLDPST